MILLLSFYNPNGKFYCAEEVAVPDTLWDFHDNAEKIVFEGNGGLHEQLFCVVTTISHETENPYHPVWNRMYPPTNLKHLLELQ